MCNMKEQCSSCFFFFSSRRRHTRLQGDWSSDVCSSDLIVDNRAGATGTIGAAYVAKAAPDGHTLLGTSIGPQAIAPHLMGKLPYDPIAGFEPVITIGTIPHLLVVGAAQPCQSVADLLAAAKAQDRKS